MTIISMLTYGMFVCTEDSRSRSRPKKKPRTSASAGAVVDVAKDDMGPEDEDSFAGIDAKGKEVYLWKRKHYLGKFSCRACELSPPDPAWSARIVNEEHVQVLMASFQKTASVNERLNAIIINTQMYQKRESILAQGEDLPPEFTDFSSLASGNDLMVFAGDHSREAASRLFSRYPNNVVWDQIPVSLYIAPENEDTFRMLRMIGNVDNMQAGLQLKSDFATLVLQMRRHYMAITGGSLNRGKSVERKKMQALKDDYAYSLQMAMPGVNQLFAIAQLPEVAWEKCEKILKGQTQPLTSSKPGKKPTKVGIPKSSHPFTLLGGLAPEVVAVLFQRVIDGRYDWAQLRAECTRLKAVIRIKSAVVEHLVQTENLTEDEHGQHTWECVKSQFPCIGNQKFVERWTRTVMKLKARDSLPVQFYDHVQATILESKMTKVHSFHSSLLFALSPQTQIIGEIIYNGVEGRRDAHGRWVPSRSVPRGRHWFGPESEAAALL